MLKVPYMFIVGAKEAEAGKVSVRKHGSGDLGAQSIDEALQLLQREIDSKGLAQS